VEAVVFIFLAAAYLGYFVCALPVAAVAAFAIYGLGMPLAYLYGLAQVLVVRPPWLSMPTRQPKLPAGADPAVLQYFYGPALVDADHAVRVAHGNCRAFVQCGLRAVGGSVSSDAALMGWPVGIGGAIGMTAGTLAGIVVTTGCAIVHLLTVGVSAACVRAIGMFLRLADSAVLRMRNINMVCPDCYERVPYPGYECPGRGCGHRHRDVRPGRFGISRRRCRCGTRMNTLLLFGSAQMNAFCPYCGRALEHRPGKAPEIVLPFFGAAGAGKTRLLLSMVTQLETWNQDGILPAAFGDSATTRELSSAREILRSQAATAKTAVKLPRSYVIRLMADRKSRILHMFDAAGELFYTSERTQELRYLSKAETFILVVDPLSVPSFWDQLPAGQQTELAGLRSNAPSPELAYQQAHLEIEAMGARLRSARLAIVFSRADLIDAPDADIATWATDTLGLGNLVRSAQLNFKEAAFFFTAAVMAGDVIHESISTLLRWVLRGHGIDPPREGPS
jgi:hypothetical protein